MCQNAVNEGVQKDNLKTYTDDAPQQVALNTSS